MKIDLSKFKKIGHTKTHTIMEHPDGHMIHVSHSALSPKHLKEAKKMATGGSVKSEPAPPQQPPGPKLDPEKTKAFIKGTGFSGGGTVEAASGAEVQKEQAERKARYEESMRNLSQPAPKHEPTSGVMEHHMKQRDRNEHVNYLEGAGYADGGEVQLEPEIPQSQPPSDAGIAGMLGNPQSSQEAPQTDPTGQAVQQLADVTALGEEQKAEQKISNAQVNLNKGLEHIEHQALQREDDYRRSVDESIREQNQELSAQQKDHENGYFHPQSLFAGKSTLGTIAAGIGLILGGAGSGVTGGENPALKVLTKRLEDNKEAGKHVYDAMLHKYGDEREALNATHLSQIQGLQHMISLEMAKANSPMATANGTKAIQELEMKKNALIQQHAQQAAQNKMLSGDQGSVDPAMLVRQRVENPTEREKVFGEIEAAQNTKKMGGSIMKAFEDAAKENTVLKTGAGLLRTPGSVYALHQSMQPTFKDLEGTVRQAAMDNTFKNITPAPGDSAHTIEQKRTALKEYLQSKASAPRAKAAGIDLSKFESTRGGEELGTKAKVNLKVFMKNNPNVSQEEAIKVLKEKGYID